MRWHVHGGVRREHHEVPGAGETAEPVDVTLQYQVADATGDPDRMMWGTVTLSVQDVPDPVTKLSSED